MSERDENEFQASMDAHLQNAIQNLRNVGVDKVSLQRAGESGVQEVDLSTMDKTNKGKIEGSDNALMDKMFKLRKKIPEDLIQELESLDESGLRKRILSSEYAIYESNRAQENDDELAAMKEKLKEMAGPYNDVKKAQTLIIKYVTCLLDSRGKI